MAVTLPAARVEQAKSGAMRSALADGRWHFQHGPIDLIIGADGEPAAVQAALDAAWLRFTSVLSELAAELAVLRQGLATEPLCKGAVARRMVQACLPHRPAFITPMAAVAGAVADELIAFFTQQSGVVRAYINNGGDIALHLQPGQCFRVGLFSDLARFSGPAINLDGDFTIDAAFPIRGIATSGWRGRSFSLGIADSVSVFAASAAQADAAATMIANQVNASHGGIVRAPASSIKDDSDLGDLLVTDDVGILPLDVVGKALDQGQGHAEGLLRSGIICGAVLLLQGQTRVVGLEQLGCPLIGNAPVQ